MFPVVHYAVQLCYQRLSRLEDWQHSGGIVSVHPLTNTLETATVSLCT